VALASDSNKYFINVPEISESSLFPAQKSSMDIIHTAVVKRLPCAKRLVILSPVIANLWHCNLFARGKSAMFNPNYAQN
jgi:hypothetical protein